MTWSLLPIVLVDICGSATVMLLALVSLRLAYRLWRLEPDNALYIFLLWLSGALTLFSLSRPVGHILQHLLLWSGYPQVWRQLAPISGSFNTITFILITSVTAFFAQFQRIYRRMAANHSQLENFSRDILNLNRDLETMVMERTMAEMALGMADGIRNPICVIGGFSHLLLRRLPPDDPTRQWLQTIAQEARRMEEMVARFEELARKREYFFVQENLHTVIEGAIKLLQPELDQKRLHCHLELAPETLICKMNPHLLRVALSHLLRNAIEATPAGGNIWLRTRRQGEMVSLELEDSGKGMPPEVVEKIFTPFFTTKIGGTGLGLVFVRQIIEEHRGTITIESAVGRGTKVTIALPQRYRPGEHVDFRPAAASRETKPLDRPR